MKDLSGFTTRQLVDKWLNGEIDSDICGDEIYSRLEGLEDEIGPKPDNSPEELAEYDLIINTIITMGLSTKLEN